MTANPRQMCFFFHRGTAGHPVTLTVLLSPFLRNPLACCLWPTFSHQNSPLYGANLSSNARGMPGGGGGGMGVLGFD